MKTKLLGLILGMGLFGPLPAVATTYNYIANPYTSNFDPSVVGTNLTGSVTFDFDTSSFTGNMDPIHVSSLSLVSGTLSFDLASSFTIQFYLTNGSITTWLLDSATPPFFNGWSVGTTGNTLPSGFEQDSVGFWNTGIPDQSSGAFDTCNGGSCVSSGWSEVTSSATPLPSTWLMLLSGFVGLGLFAYRGTKKNAATLAAA
jgi:hypothetical protein